MPQNTYNGFSTGRINTRGYDPSLAEEEMARQDAANKQQLAQLAQQGQIQAQGNAELGNAAAQGLSGAVGGYYQGKAQAQKGALTEEELANQQAQNQLMGQTNEGQDLTNRERLLNAQIGKAEEEANGGKEAPYVDTKFTSGGHPVVFNKKTGKPEVVPDINVDQPNGAITPYQQKELELRGKQIESTAADRKEREDLKKSEKLDQKTHQYSQDLNKSGLPEAFNQLERVYSKVPPAGDAPGYGVVAGALPNWAVSQEGKDARQEVAALFNVELKNRNGSRITDPELDRLKQEFGQGTWQNADQLRKGLQQYESRLRQLHQNVTGGTSPEVMQNYVANGGRDFSQFGGRPNGVEPQADGTAQAGTGKTAVKKEHSASRKATRVTYSDGTSEIVPDAGK